MNQTILAEPPRIDAVAVVGPTRLLVTWRPGHRRSTIELEGWIGRGNVHIAPLSDPIVFARATVGAYGGNITWDDDEGDLAIDASHLELIAAEQEPFRAAEAEEWQRSLGLSDPEAAGVLGIPAGTWASYKAGALIPETIVRLCRAVRRDPVILHAHLRTRRVERAAGP